MKIDQFLSHHGIGENPFSQEDALSDHVFRDHCLEGTRHPAWDKIFGSPENLATSVVFGQKGSGKTALRLQIVERLEHHNSEHPDSRVFIIEYDDFNPFLDCFRERLRGRKRKPERALSYWRLWDHMDAILSLGVTQLVAQIVHNGRKPDADDPLGIAPDRIAVLSHLERRDLLMLAAFYDKSLDLPVRHRWNRLRRRLKFSTWQSDWDRWLGFAVTVVTLACVWRFGDEWKDFIDYRVWLAIAAGWLPWLSRQWRLFWAARRISRQIRVIDHLPNTLRSILSRFQRHEIFGQPIPSKERGDDRYELIRKFQSILQVLGFKSIAVLVDRVDEPHLVNGSPERMRDLLWPLFDNKFLKHPGIGFKLLLPAEVVYFLNRAEKEFYERSRLDKQNLVLSFEWTGQSLYDVANDRIAGCALSPEKTPVIRDLFDDSISEQELVEIFGRLRVPRHLFKFLYRLLVEHCNRFTGDQPSWQISRETLQSTLAVYLKGLEAFDQGAGTG